MEEADGFQYSPRRDNNKRRLQVQFAADRTPSLSERYAECLSALCRVLTGRSRIASLDDDDKPASPSRRVPGLVTQDIPLTVEEHDNDDDDEASLETQIRTLKLRRCLVEEIASGDAEVSRRGLMEIAFLASSPEARRHICRTGGPTSILSAMKRQREQVGVQTAGLLALVNATFDCLEAKSTTVEMGGDEIVVDAMVEHVTSPRIQRLGCAALANLSNSRRRHAETFVNAGGMEAILGAIRLHPDDVELQRHAVRALYNLLLSDTHCASMLDHHNALVPLVEILERHRGDEQLHEWASHVVRVLSSR